LYHGDRLLLPVYPLSPDDPAKVQEYMGYVVHETSRLTRMLTEVMEFSRPVRVKREVQPLNPVVERAVHVVKQQVPEEVTLTLTLDPELPSLLLDSGSVEQVVINLVRNAVEAVGEQGKVQVQTRVWNGGAAIVVEDDGPGIPEETQARIFEPFFTTKRQGNGLGLPICREIVAEHGGHILLNSTPGRGASFTVTLEAEGANGNP
ncbi:MAG: hypothetical protein C4524_12715, partial [Candidatus Zixiibacteriota bacterium]